MQQSFDSKARRPCRVAIAMMICMQQSFRLQGKAAVSGGDVNDDLHATTLRLQGKAAMSGDDVNKDLHATTLRLQGKAAV